LPYLVILKSQSGLSQIFACLRCRILHILKRIQGTEFRYFVGLISESVKILTYKPIILDPCYIVWVWKLVSRMKGMRRIGNIMLRRIFGSKIDRTNNRTGENCTMKCFIICILCHIWLRQSDPKSVRWPGHAVHIRLIKMKTEISSESWQGINYF
jgi:hypothetical protein